MQFGFMFRRLSWVRLALSRIVGLVPLVALVITGCGKPERPTSPSLSAESPSGPLPRRVVLATHWIGKIRMAQDTNAAYQMEIWNMPESAHLEAQTLDKLARALPTLLGIPSGRDTNGLAGLIRPLLDDLVQAESFAEVRAITNQSAEFVLAIRLSSERLALWQTNVAVLRAALSGSKAGATRLSESLEFSVSEDWAVLGLGADAGAHFTDGMRRFSTTNIPMSAANSPWFVLDADLSWLLRSNSIFTDQSLPSVHITLAGEGQTVRTRAEVTFPRSIEIELEPWKVPTNLIHDPLIGFTAVRGIKGVIESASGWWKLQMTNKPKQLFTWALRGSPFEFYQAAVWPDPTNNFSVLASEIVTNLNPILTSNGWGAAKYVSESNGIIWSETPFFEPFIKLSADENGSFIFGGFYPPSRDSRPIPPELLAQITSETNLIYYDWEITEGRAMGWLYLAQTLRMIFQKAQLEPESAGLKWVLAVSPKLGNSVTAMRLMGSNRLSFARTASVGLTGVEIQALVDWVESPDFPVGLNTLRPLAKTKSASRQKDLAPSPATNGVNVQPVVGP